MEEDKIKKVELLKKLISLKNDVDEYKRTSTEERRRLKVDIERKGKELKTMIKGNKEDIDRLWRRDDDHAKELKELQEVVQWAWKTIAGVLITVVIGFIIKSFIGL